MTENTSILTMLDRDKFMIEDAVIRFANFSGAPDRYSTTGYNKGSFHVFLTEDQAATLSEHGYYISRLNPMEEDPDDPGQPMIKIYIGFQYFPNRVYRLVGEADANPLELDADSVKGLDHDTITKADISCTPYRSHASNGTGQTAYLASDSYFTVYESPLARKYRLAAGTIDQPVM